MKKLAEWRKSIKLTDVLMGVALDMLISICLCIAVSAMINGGILPENTLDAAVCVIAFVSTFSAAMFTMLMTKEGILISGAAECIIAFLIKLSAGLLFFEGRIAGVALRLLITATSGALACLISIKIGSKNGRRKKRNR